MFWLTITTVLLITPLKTIALMFPKDFAPYIQSNNYPVNFHFIVVGGGSAGSTIAARLSEVSEWNVLLLEAGGDPPPQSEIPLQWGSMLRTENDWNFMSETDDKMFKGLVDERVYLPRGRMLGGSSSMNVMVYLRGDKQDFDKWNNAGCTDWGYDSVLPYFKKSENFTDASRFNATIHEKGGPLTISPYMSPDPAIPVISEALRSLGLSPVSDLNRPEPVIGFGMADSTTRDGLRCSTLKAFLFPAKDRSNLFVAKNTRVTKIIFDKNRQATGVEIITPNGIKKEINCSLEVIVSAGVIMSPQLLMLSGVGPEKHLKEMNIDLVVDLPVGQNYQDHVSYLGLVFTDRKNRTKEDIKNQSENLINETLQFTKEGKSTMGLTGLITYINTNSELIYPDVELMKIRFSYNSLKNTWNGKNKLTNFYGISEDVAELYNELNMKSDTIFIVPISNTVKSTGHIKLNSTDPLMQPKIVNNFLKNEEEVDMLIKAIEFVVQLSKTDPMIKAGFVLEELKFPNCVQYEWATREYWKCGINQVATSFYHEACTNKMGPLDDPTAVVDSNFNVIGVNKLRVIDGSSMPYLVSCNPNAVTIMMAERGSDFIKTKYGKK